jgi:ABC-type phosphate transport system ATPase subunit
MTRHILDSLLEAIEDFSIHLRTVSQNTEPLHTKIYENIYFVIDMFDHVLQDCKGQGSNIKDESASQGIVGQLQTADILSEVSERLDQCVLYISDKYPLFVCKIWLIK